MQRHLLFFLCLSELDGYGVALKSVSLMDDRVAEDVVGVVRRSFCFFISWSYVGLCLNFK